MTEDNPLTIYQGDHNIQNCPNEIIIYIFAYLEPKCLSRCRSVCWRWKSIVDSLFKNDKLWRRHCQNDFTDIYKMAYYKRKPELSWVNLYRSLSLWSKLQYATETNDEFASASCIRDEIHDFRVLRHGEIGVHIRDGIVYYDIKTLNRSNRETIFGDYLSYVEDDNVILVMEFTFSLHLIRKVVTSPRHETEAWFPSINSFLLHENLLYYVNYNNEIYICDLLKEKIESRLLIHMEDGFICIGYKNGHLSVLTMDRHIFVIVGKEKIFQRSLDDLANPLHEMYKFNLLERLDWRIYFHWMYVLNRALPEGTIRDVIVAKIYGDVVFIGSSLGVLRIYHSPYTNNEFDIFNTEPVKQYNFMDRSDCPVLSESPIIQIDVLEGEYGHTVLVGMPKKIAVLNFSHDIQRCVSESQFEDLRSVEIIDVNN